MLAPSQAVCCVAHFDPCRLEQWVRISECLVLSRMPIRNACPHAMIPMNSCSYSCSLTVAIQPDRVSLATHVIGGRHKRQAVPEHMSHTFSLNSQTRGSTRVHSVAIPPARCEKCWTSSRRRQRISWTRTYVSLHLTGLVGHILNSGGQDRWYHHLVHRFATRSMQRRTMRKKA